MGNFKKISIGAAAAVGMVMAAKLISDVVGEYGRKYFYKGFDTGRLVGEFTAEKNLSRKYTKIIDRYNKLCEEHQQLENEYNEILDYYDGDESESFKSV